jgi:hypothetical protein
VPVPAITADAASVSALTVRFVQGSASYQALGPVARRAVDVVLAGTTADLAYAGPLKRQYVDGYKAGLEVLALGAWLTPLQAVVLRAFADAL